MGKCHWHSAKFNSMEIALDLTKYFTVEKNEDILPTFYFETQIP